MIVIPMAGESSRFRDAGYECVKYMLPVSGRPLFDWVLLSFHTYFKTQPFLFIARDNPQNIRFVEERIEFLGIEKAEIVVLDGPTAGQAETVERGLLRAGVAGDVGVSIFNIDTIRPQIELQPFANTSGWVEVFSASGDSWSFVDPDPAQSNLMLQCVEKKRISELCCTGLYNFSRADLFMYALSEERRRPSMDELFIAPLYNHLICAGHKFGWRSVLESTVVPSGVPREYESLIERGLDLDIFLPKVR